MDTKQVIARFEAERQALAMMDHPAIATVFDAGATENGRPYFVMELVDGEPITKFCDEQKLSIRERLELFCDVCAAVQHAHQKSVIHRDIKPSNVLVARNNGRHLPKVIDFGVAKATESKLSEHTILTQVSQLVGTPSYMSPEQAGGSPIDIDTRSDVYSLGVLLYELLTGATPIDSKTRSRSSYEQIQCLIMEVTPPKPSTRLGGDESTAEIAERRHTEHRKLLQQIQGDLDWIVMKSLEKERARRYETVNAFADDIRRYLSDEPIIARPPSKGYTLNKFVHRNRGSVIAGVTIFCVLLLGITGTTWGMIWALDERGNARMAAEEEQQAKVSATKAAELAASEAELAAREAQTAEELSRFFVMDVLSAADPARTANRELTVREALLNASENIEGRFDDRPDFEMKIHNALGFLSGRLGATDRSEYHHRREWKLTEQEYGEISFENARIMHSVVNDLAMQERDEEAIELTQRQLSILDQLDSPEVEQFRFRAMGNHGALLVRAGRVTEAAPILSQVLEMKRVQYGNQHPTTLSGMEAHSVVLGRVGEHDRAIVLAEEAYTGMVEVLGEGDARTLNSLVNLALAHGRLDQHEQAQGLLQHGIEIAMERLGEEHPTSIYIRSNYARSLFNSKQYEKAENESRELLQLIELTDPEMTQRQSRMTLTVLASCLTKSEKYEEAMEVAYLALESARKGNPVGDARLGDYLALYAETLIDLGRYQNTHTILAEAWGCIGQEQALADQIMPVARAYVRLYTAWIEMDSSGELNEQLAHWESILDQALGG